MRIVETELRDDAIGAGVDGILILEDGSARPGTPLTEAFPFVRDFIFEIGLTPPVKNSLSCTKAPSEFATIILAAFRSSAISQSSESGGR